MKKFNKNNPFESLGERIIREILDKTFMAQMGPDVFIARVVEIPIESKVDPDELRLRFLQSEIHEFNEKQKIAVDQQLTSAEIELICEVMPKEEVTLAECVGFNTLKMQLYTAFLIPLIKETSEFDHFYKTHFKR